MKKYLIKYRKDNGIVKGEEIQITVPGPELNFKLNLIIDLNYTHIEIDLIQ